MSQKIAAFRHPSGPPRALALRRLPAWHNREGAWRGTTVYDDGTPYTVILPNEAAGEAWFQHQARTLERDGYVRCPWVY